MTANYPNLVVPPKRVFKDPFSSGAKKDLLVIFFARSLIYIALDLQEEDKLGAITRKEDNKNFKANKRIDRRLQKLLDQIDLMVSEIPEALMKTLHIWLRGKLTSKIKTVLQKLSHVEVQLETLALWVLFCNFENRKILMSIYKPFQEANLYFDNIELLEGVGISEDTSADMYRLAYDVISQIKG